MRKLLLLLPLVVLLCACKAGPEPDVTQSDMWRVEILSAEKAENLTATLAAVQYNGDILETSSDFKAGDGKTFLLLEMIVEKVGTGKSSFTWKDAHIEDKDGNQYYRHSNDTFLANLNLKRLKGTDITFGKEDGFACFEVPQSAEGLQLVADGGNIKIKVKV